MAVFYDSAAFFERASCFAGNAYQLYLAFADIFAFYITLP